MNLRLFLTKKEIGIQTDKEDTYLNVLISSACEEIAAMGIKLKKDSYSDENLVARYAAWKYRTRKTGESMPDSLRFSIRNRLIHEKAGVKSD